MASITATRTLPVLRRSLPLLARPRYAWRGYSSHESLPQELGKGMVIRYPHQDRARVLMPGEESSDRGIKIAVIGASGNVGRQISTSLAANNAHCGNHLGPITLQFVGRRDSDSLGILIGLCSELRDAYNSELHLEVAVDLEAVHADVIILAAGASLSDQFRTYADLIRVNADRFDEYAQALVSQNSKAYVLIVSNPMEFGVESFVQAGFCPRQVLGTGAYLESTRFRREIASELNVPRQLVGGLTLGKHGLAMVPCWSTVRVTGLGRNVDIQDKVEKMKEEGLKRLEQLDLGAVRSLAYKVRDAAASGKALEAAALVSSQPPELRAKVRKYVSYFSGPMYPRVGLGEAVSRFVTDIITGNTRIMSAQVRSAGDFLDIDGVIGAPICLQGDGAHLASLPLAPSEIEAVKKSFLEVQDMHKSVRAIKYFRRAVGLRHSGH